MTRIMAGNDRAEIGRGTLEPGGLRIRDALKRLPFPTGRRAKVVGESIRKVREAVEKYVSP